MRLSVVALAVSLLAPACGGAGDTAKPPAPSTAPPSEPVFKPIDPAAPVTLPAPPNTATPSPTSAGGTGEPVAMVTDLASGWPINLRVGQSMTARLTADKSGARWSMRPGSDGGIVTLAGAPAQETPAAGPAVEVFRLVAAKPGKTTLIFDLGTGAPAAALKSASYPVTVE